MSWDKVKIGDCCEITSSKRIFFSEYVECGVPFYRSKEIIESSNGQAISEPLFISEEKYDEIRRNFGVPQSGDMLLTSVGTIGVPYIVKEDDYFYFKDGNLTWFRKFNNKLTSQYLYYWVRSAEGQGVLNNTTIGSSQKALTIASLKGLEIPCPPVDVQGRIVEILYSYDALIENNQKQIKLLEETAQRLYKEWFVDLRFPGHETIPITDGIPEGWKRDELNSIIGLLSGFAFKSADFTNTGTYKIVTIKNVQDGMFDGHNVSRIAGVPSKMPAHCYLSNGDILLSLTGNVGRVCVVNGSDYLLNQRVAKIKSDYPAFAYCLFRSNDMFVEMGNIANGAAQQNLSPIKTGQIKILIPPVELLVRFEEVVSVYMKQMLNLNEQIELLQEARDRLLPKLMNGEIEV